MRLRGDGISGFIWMDRASMHVEFLYFRLIACDIWRRPHFTRYSGYDIIKIEYTPGQRCQGRKRGLRHMKLLFAIVQNDDQKTLTYA
jgi:hypothetical protein